MQQKVRVLGSGDVTASPTTIEGMSSAADLFSVEPTIPVDAPIRSQALHPHVMAMQKSATYLRNVYFSRTFRTSDLLNGSIVT